MAMVDYMATKLSEYTGSEVEVLRGRDENGLMRYGLKMSRDGHSHTFQAHRPMKLNELTRWLASICDMIMMGYIPVSFLWKDDKDAR